MLNNVLVWYMRGVMTKKLPCIVIIKNLRGNCCIVYLCYFDQVVILSHRMMYIYLHVTLHSLDHQQTNLNKLKSS